MRYFVRSKFFENLVHKKMLGYFRILILSKEVGCLLSLNELEDKLQVTIILDKFVNNPKSNFCELIVFGKCFSLVKI